MSVKFWFIPTFGIPPLQQSLESAIRQKNCQVLANGSDEIPNVVLLTDFDHNLEHVKNLRVEFGDDPPLIVVVRTTSIQDEVKAKRFRKAGAMVVSYPTATNTPTTIINYILRQLPDYLAATA